MWSRSMSTAARWTRSAARQATAPEPAPPAALPPPPHKWGGVGVTRLEGDVAVLARRPFHRLTQAQLQSAHKLASGLTRLDDVVDVATFRRDVGVGETRRVLGDELLAPRSRVAGAGEVAFVDDVHGCVGAHHRDLGRRPGEVQVGAHLLR